MGVRVPGSYLSVEECRISCTAKSIHPGNVGDLFPMPLLALCLLSMRFHTGGFFLDHLEPPRLPAIDELCQFADTDWLSRFATHRFGNNFQFQ